MRVAWHLTLFALISSGAGLSVGPAANKRVMFICKANSCRSQMAHGFLEEFAGVARMPIKVESSGCIEASTVNPNAATVMNELGIDLSSYTSNALDEYDPTAGYDAVVCLCGCAELVPQPWKNGSTGAFMDWDVDDPPELDPGDLTVYRRVRDELQVHVRQLLGELYAP